MPVTYRALVHAFKAAVVRHMLAAHRGNRTQTARALGMQRENLMRLIKRYGIGKEPTS